MSPGPPKAVLVCPECGANNPEAAPACWMCDGPLSPGLAKRELLPEPSPPPPTTFRLGALMVAIALIAVFLGVAREAPGLAILLAVVATPALLVTLGKSWQRRAEGFPMSATEKAGTFLFAAVITVAAILGLLLITGVAFVAALWVICSGSCRF
jgi:hypothetical protein